jgi:hypothetical protein
VRFGRVWRWRVEIRDVDGTIVNRCRIDGRASRCERAHVD